MKKLLGIILFSVYASNIIHAQGLTYTPFFRETVPVPQYQSSRQQPQYRQHDSSYRRQAKGTVECVKNCIAILPDGEEPIIVYVHVKRFSDSNRSLGFIEPDSGTFYMFGNDSDGLEQLVRTSAVDPSMAEKWPYFVVFNTNAGEIICFLPNLYISKVSIYDFENLHKKESTLNKPQVQHEDGRSEEYLTYYNERFGYYITYPSYLYIQGESQNADGKSFYSNNATIKLSVGAHLNILNEAIAGLANSERQDLTASNHSITYSFVKDSKVIYSGYTPTGNIYYQKSVICSLYSSVYKEKINLITTAYIEYPSTEKTKGDEIIKLLNKFPYK